MLECIDAVDGARKSFNGRSDPVLHGERNMGIADESFFEM